MPVLPKYQLKELFEAGDLITENTLDEFIEAAYNPTLVAGSNITLTKVSTPSGDTITISSTGGGGSSVTEGPGIQITTVGSDEEIAIKLDTSQTNIIIDGNDRLTFAGVHVEDEGTAVGTYKTINFIGNDVLAEDSGTPGKVNVYVPTPTFASHFNTTDGTTNGIVSENIIDPNGGYWSRSTVRISKPTVEGSPFKTNGWATTNQDAYPVEGTSKGAINFDTAAAVTGFSANASGDATITTNVYDADGTTLLHTYTTPTLYTNGTYNPANDTRVVVTITNFATDTSKYKANVRVQIQPETIFTDDGLEGGRYHTEIIMNTDTATDGGGTYTYTQDDIFLDRNPSTPVINGSTAISEKTGSITTKHLSGVEYYIAGSKFEMDVTDIDTFNANTQGRGESASWNFRAQGGDYNLPTLQITAWSPSYGTFSGTNWPDFYNASDVDWTYDDWTIPQGNYRFRNDDANVQASVFDPWNSGNTVTSSNARILIDTYATSGNSNSLRERFDDEQYRLQRGSSSYGGWNSTAALGSGVSFQTGNAGPFDDACLVGSNLIRADKFFKDNGNSPQYSSLTGTLAGYKPNLNGTNPDYSNYTDTPTYHRLFETTTNPAKVITSFELAFTGDFVSNAFNDLLNDDMRIYIRKKIGSSAGVTNVGHGAVPHSLHGTAYNFANYQDPPTGVDASDGSAQCRTGSTPGNTVSGTFGGSNALNGFYVEIQLLDPSIRIDQIIATLNFSDGTSQSG